MRELFLQFFGAFKTLLNIFTFQVCFFIIQLLLLKPQDFRSRVSELVKTMSPEHHLVKDFQAKHMELHQKSPERFHPDNENSAPSLPTYFGNVCLRFIPVFDIVVHRYVEFKIFQLGSFILTSEYLPPAAKLKLRYASASKLFLQIYFLDFQNCQPCQNLLKR